MSMRSNVRIPTSWLKRTAVFEGMMMLNRSRWTMICSCLTSWIIEAILWFMARFIRILTSEFTVIAIADILPRPTRLSERALSTI